MKPKIHYLLEILLMHDFIFTSEKIPDYYNIVKPMIDALEKEGESVELYRTYKKINNTVKREISDEMKVLRKKYNLHGCSCYKWGFSLASFLVKKHFSTEKINYYRFHPYFQKFTLNRATGAEDDEAELEEYHRLLKLVRDEYERIKDIPTIYECAPYIRIDGFPGLLDRDIIEMKMIHENLITPYPTKYWTRKMELQKRFKVIAEEMGEVFQKFQNLLSHIYERQALSIPESGIQEFKEQSNGYKARVLDMRKEENDVRIKNLGGEVHLWCSCSTHDKNLDRKENSRILCKHVIRTLLLLDGATLKDLFKKKIIFVPDYNGW
ncbi:MAG: hypothetical protein ACFFCS_12855 [Candidatus Hodarchaeota archaeon]